MTKFSPYLLFNGTCAEAMRFYQTCFGGDLNLMTVEESPMKAQLSPEQYEKIVNAKLLSDVVALSASDWLHPTRSPKQGNTVCLYISDAPQDLVENYFQKLAEGADPVTLDPLQTMPFGSYGALTDRYGIRWMFQGSIKK